MDQSEQEKALAAGAGQFHAAPRELLVTDGPRDGPRDGQRNELPSRNIDAVEGMKGAWWSPGVCDWYACETGSCSGSDRVFTKKTAHRVRWAVGAVNQVPASCYWTT